MTFSLAIDVRPATGGEWLVGAEIPDFAEEISVEASGESVFAGQELVFACVPNATDDSRFLLIAQTPSGREVLLHLTPEVVEELYGPTPSSERWLTWLRRHSQS